MPPCGRRFPHCHGSESDSIPTRGSNICRWRSIFGLATCALYIMDLAAVVKRGFNGCRLRLLPERNAFVPTWSHKEDKRVYTPMMLTKCQYHLHDLYSAYSLKYSLRWAMCASNCRGEESYFLVTYTACEICEWMCYDVTVQWPPFWIPEWFTVA